MLDVRHLNKRFGSLAVTQDVNLSVARGERRLILGPNGAGKTTLFNLLVGELASDSGEIHLDGERVDRLGVDARARLGLARSYQKNNLFDALSVAENLALAVTAARGLSSNPWRDTHRDASVQEDVERVAAQVGLEARLHHTVSDTAYGERRQLEVGMALASGPKLLMMDEPTSGVGPAMIDGFRQLLQSLPTDLTILIVEHDMDFALDLADRITVLNYGEVVFEGTPSEARESALVREIYLGADDA